MESNNFREDLLEEINKKMVASLQLRIDSKKDSQEVQWLDGYIAALRGIESFAENYEQI